MKIGSVCISKQEQLSHATSTRSKMRAVRKVYNDLLFSLMSFDAQYVSKLFRYFNQVMGDFRPHQTIAVLTYLSPFPSFKPAGSSPSDNYLLRRFPLFRLAAASDFSILHDRLKREQSMWFYSIVSMLNSHMENESIHFLRNVIV